MHGLLLSAVALLALCGAARASGAVVTNYGAGSYTSGSNTYFHPAKSSTFELVKLGNVNVTFLDKTNLLGYDGADFVEVGGYRVKTRLGLILECNSANFDAVDGILGFGWANNTRTAALLKTLTTHGRPHWHITQPSDFVPMPRIFSFFADYNKGELQLGGWDPTAVDGTVHFFPMTGLAYGVNVTSITWGIGGPELFHFSNKEGNPTGVEEPTWGPGVSNADTGPAYVGEFDSGTTCLLLPNSTVNGTFTKPPYTILSDLETGSPTKQPLIYTIGGRKYSMPYHECVDAADTALILGDAWFRRFVVVHDLRDLGKKRMGLGKLKSTYPVAKHTDMYDDTLDGEVASLAENPGAGGVKKMAASRRVMLSEDHPLQQVRKVPLSSSQHVTYSIKLAIGTPRQPLEVIFDTGSYMLAVFSDPAPKGLVPTGLLSRLASSTPLVGMDSPTASALAMAVMAAGLVVLAANRLRVVRHAKALRAAPPSQPTYGSLATTEV